MDYSTVGTIKHHLLFIDDDIEVLNVNSKYFKQRGFTVSTAASADNALEQLASIKPDCIIMDIMMPGLNGFKAFTEIRHYSSAPVIYLTGKSSEDDKIQGLLLGADDYIVKPYSFRELEARILVIIRRYQNTSSEIPAHILDYGLLKINLIDHKVMYESEEILLSAKEFLFLKLLASAPDQEFTFEDIGNELWGTYLESDRKTIMVTASRLRKKLSLYPGLENCIETIWSKGYRFSKGMSRI